MSESVDLEIGLLWRREYESFHVTLHASTPDKQADHIELPQSDLRLDVDRLSWLSYSDPTEYARELSGVLFSVDHVESFLNTAASVAERDAKPLHLRLLLDPRAPAEYHTLRWETLLDPRDQSPLALKPQLSLSRFVNAKDWRQVRLRPQRELTALIIVPDPDPDSLGRSGEYQPSGRQLAPIAVADEVGRAQRALNPIRTEVLAERGSCHLPAVLRRLKCEDDRNEGFDIVYVVCHGAVLGQGPVLYMESEEGRALAVPGSEFVEAVTELGHPPTLIVLASCQGAGGSSPPEEMHPSALGPTLAANGIPAVVAMNGDVAAGTAERFTSAFLTSLRSTGSIYEALLQGRRAIRDRDDWWAPVLFTRLRGGRIWFKPGFHANRMHRWPTLVQSIKQGFCTPVLGPRLSEPFFPSRKEVARGIATRWQVPVSPQSLHDLTRVSQYLAVTQADSRFPRMALTTYLVDLITRKDRSGTGNAATSDPEPTGSPSVTAAEDCRVNELVSELGKKARSEDPQDAYRQLAELPFPVYFTTSWTNVLEDALKEVGRDPQVATFQWKKQRGEGRSLTSGSPQRPLIFRLFGNLDDIDSVVLTEDDYFEYSTSWALTGGRKALSGVLNKLTNANLLILGFGLDDWDFRVLFRSIQTMEGARRLRDLAHVAVQLNPESESLEPEVAQQYLEDYLGKTNFSIHWGSAAEFLGELKQRWSEYV